MVRNCVLFIAKNADVLSMISNKEMPEKIVHVLLLMAIVVRWEQ